MIRVGINARALTKPDPAGVSHYTCSLLEALGERSADDGLEYLVFGVESLPESLSQYDRVRNAGEPAPAHSGLRSHCWEQFVLPLATRRHDLDVFHTPAGQPPVLSGHSDVALVTTIHDISPVVHPEWFSRGYGALYRVLTPLAVRTAERIITVSEFARDEIVETYPSAADKTVSIYNGVTPPVAPGTPVEGLDSDSFLLFVGAANRRKNLRTLLLAYRQYRTRTTTPVPLALAGPERNIFTDLDYNVPAGVRPLGYVSDAQLGWLYRNAAAFVFPSLYEGFGLPIVEAMHAGTPVVTSNRGAMAEVADDAAHLVDPLDAEHLSEGIKRALSDEPTSDRRTERGKERAAEFTWEQTAAQTAAVYRAVAEQ